VGYFNGQINTTILMEKTHLVKSYEMSYDDQKIYNYISNDATENKKIQFDIKNKNGQEKVVFGPLLQGQAHYCPFIFNTFNWNELKKTEVSLRKIPRNTDLNSMFTAGTLDSYKSSPSYLIAVGKDDIKVYCDSNPTSYAKDKIDSILSEGDRHIIRVDQKINSELYLPAHQHLGAILPNSSENTLSTTSISLHYNYGKWHLIYQLKELDSANSREIIIGSHKQNIQIDYKINPHIFYETIFRENEKLVQNPIKFYDENFIIQNHEAKPGSNRNLHLEEQKSKKIIQFDICPRNNLNGKRMFDIDMHKNGELIAHYVPYKTNNFDYNELNKTSALVKLNNPDQKYVVTADFSGCAFIIGVGKRDMRIYHDRHPTTNSNDKLARINAENRRAIRIDHLDNLNESELNKWNKRFYYGKDGYQDKRGHIMMFYHNDEWYIAITSLSRRKIEIDDISTIPNNVQIIRLLDLI